MIGKGKGTAEV